MKILFLIVALLWAPALTANAAHDKAPAETAAPEQPSANATKAGAPSANATTTAAPGEYECKYYKVKLPAGWKAIVAPEEQLGNVNAIFATDTGSAVLAMVAGPSSGEDAQTIAAMFAEQFKAKKAPVLRNGLYTFQFPLQNSTATAWVASYDGNFMMTYIAGNMSQGQKFLKEAVSSDTWPGLLPK